jgi:hypothetical protein
MEIQTHGAEWIDLESHCAFDWNGWGIGVEPECGPDYAPEFQPPGESIETWRIGVREIVDLC